MVDKERVLELIDTLRAETQPVDGQDPKVIEENWEWLRVAIESI